MHQVVDNEIYIRISTNKQKRNQRKYRLSYTRCFGVCMYMRVRHFQKLQTSSLQSSSLVTLQKKKNEKASNIIVHVAWLPTVPCKSGRAQRWINCYVCVASCVCTRV